ncbi:hypothetical protein ACFC26_31030 [Kitasatospora purpeofusca]|uniref:hypothetical protein n=1 Tax=Kitasatospora purpeofusca TaxID=67352 RepID=UPI0035DD1798
MTTDTDGELKAAFRRAIEAANAAYNTAEHTPDHRFELEISRGWWDETNASRYVSHELYALMLERDPALRTADLDTVRAATLALRAELAPELDRYLAYCRSGTFSGWSHAASESEHPVIHHTTEERPWTAPYGQKARGALESVHPANRAHPERP